MKLNYDMIKSATRKLQIFLLIFFVLYVIIVEKELHKL